MVLRFYLIIYLVFTLDRGICDHSIESALKNAESKIITKRERDEVTETQHATCTITSEELVASAQATVTRVLSGVCDSGVIKERLDNLESDLTTRLNELKELLGKVLNDGKKSEVDPIDQTEYGEPQRATDDVEREGCTEIDDSTSRRNEIIRFNNTVREDLIVRGMQSRVFTYYWKIGGLKEKLYLKQRDTRASPLIVIRPGDRIAYLEFNSHWPMASVTLCINVIRGRLNTPIRMRIEILGRTTTRDRSSGTCDPRTFCYEYFGILGKKYNSRHCAEFRIPEETGRPSPSPVTNCSSASFPEDYFNGDGLTVKLTVTSS